jgi:outer membrane protein assembly factor BamD (BamD/ComL family)
VNKAKGQARKEKAFILPSRGQGIAAPRPCPFALLPAAYCLLPFAFCLLSGCVGLPEWAMFKKPPAPPGPAEDLVLKDGKLEKNEGPVGKVGATAVEMDGAKELFRRNEYVKAEAVFHRIANDTKNTPQIAEEARYYEAECLRLQGRYPKAADTYSKLLKDFSMGQFRDQANQRLFDIANYWLDDTRAEMAAYREQKDGKRWFVMPASYFHWDKTKPLFDEESWALQKLEEIQLDLHGPLADRALFYAGSVKFFRKDYREADQNFSQLTQMLPNSPLAPQALKMAIICKQLSTGGPDYDGRKTAEARELIHTAGRAYPELKAKEEKFLYRQLDSINQQQAAKDYRIAEFYKRTGHPGSAYFYYEIVRRRYPNTPYFDKATERMHELKAVLEKEQQKAAEAPKPSKPLLTMPNLFQKTPPPAQVLPAPQGGTETAPQPRPVPTGPPAQQDGGQVVPGTMLLRPATAPQTLPADLTGRP